MGGWWLKKKKIKKWERGNLVLKPCFLIVRERERENLYQLGQQEYDFSNKIETKQLQLAHTGDCLRSLPDNKFSIERLTEDIKFFQTR